MCWIILPGLQISFYVVQYIGVIRFYIFMDVSILINADNLLLTANQKSVKLADFGLAREESVTEMMTAETGTYRWMAPEVCVIYQT